MKKLYVLSENDLRKLAELLLNPPPPTPALIRAKERYKINEVMKSKLDDFIKEISYSGIYPLSKPAVIKEFIRKYPEYNGCIITKDESAFRKAWIDNVNPLWKRSGARRKLTNQSEQKGVE